MKAVLNLLLKVRMTEKIFHHIKPPVNRLHILQREYNPTFQHTCPHRAYSMVYHIKQTRSTIVHTSHQFQTAGSKLIYAHILFLFYARQRCDMSDMLMLSHFKILKNSSRSYHTILQMFHSETFQIFRFKMLEQFLHSRCLSENPVVKFESKEFGSEISFEHRFLSTFEKYLLRSKIIEKLVDIIKFSFCSHKLSGRNIQKSHAASCLSKMNGSQKVVLLIRKNIVANGNTRCNKLGYTAFHQFLGGFRVFQLVTDSHTSSCSDKFWQICIKSMVRKSRHLDSLVLSVGPFCKGNAQNLGCCHRIFRIRLIKVSASEKHDSIRVLRLQVEKLFHHGGHYYFAVFCHGKILSFILFDNFYCRTKILQNPRISFMPASYFLRSTAPVLSPVSF